MSDYKAIKQTIKVFIQKNSPSHPAKPARTVIVTFFDDDDAFFPLLKTQICRAVDT